jgi:hypothetical protein
MLYNLLLLIPKILTNQILNTNIEELSIIPKIYDNTSYGLDERFEINKKIIDYKTLENISINIQKKELIFLLENNKISINKKLELIKKNEILIPNYISQYNFFSGGLIKDFDF